MAVPRFTSMRGGDKRDNKPFGFLYLEGLQPLADLRLRGMDWRVLLALIEQATYNNSFLYSNKTIALAIDMSHAQVSQSLRNLRNLGVVLDVGPERNRVIINPRYFWVGDRSHRVLWQMELKRLHPQHMLWYAPTPEERELAKEATVQKSGQPAGYSQEEDS